MLPLNIFSKKGYEITKDKILTIFENLENSSNILKIIKKQKNNNVK